MMTPEDAYTLAIFDFLEKKRAYPTPEEFELSPSIASIIESRVAGMVQDVSAAITAKSAPISSHHKKRGHKRLGAANY